MLQLTWQAELAAAFTRPDELLEFLDLQDLKQAHHPAAAKAFPLRVTRSFAERMVKGDPADPLLRQVLPLPDEDLDAPGFCADPVGDLAAVAAPGLLHKYQGRALLVVTGACAIHCRYCFRREFPYGAEQLSRQREAAALDYLNGDASIREVILSGGDPLVLSDDRLAELVRKLETVSHLGRLRLHSRLPVVLPARITEALAALLAGTRFQTVMVIHANHGREIDRSVGRALAQLKEAGVTLLNQSVLLRGVNDDAETLAELSEVLFEHGVMPYYLHLLDKARGTAHFEVSDAAAQDLHEQLRRALPGYLVPRLVREAAGAPFKLPVI